MSDNPDDCYDMTRDDMMEFAEKDVKAGNVPDFRRHSGFKYSDELMYYKFYARAAHLEIMELKNGKEV